MLVKQKWLTYTDLLNFSQREFNLKQEKTWSSRVLLAIGFFVLS